MMSEGWPARVIAGLGRAPRVGDWYAECCQEDLFRINAAAQLEDIQARHADGMAIGQFFQTEAAARTALPLNAHS